MNTTILLSRRAVSSVCLSCRRSLLRERQFSSSPLIAFQAYPLPSQQPPPSQSSQSGSSLGGARNAAVPDSSIAQPFPRVHETRPPPNSAAAPSAATAPAEQAPVSLPEREAQASKTEFAEDPATTPSTSASAPSPSSSPASPKTTTATATASTSTSPLGPTPRAKTSRPSKLRTPRKAAMKLTPTAVAHLRSLLEGPEPKLIKVGVRNRGCSGLAYHLEYVDKAGAFDETVEQDGVLVLIDSKALFSIIGSEMDWVEDKLSQRFVFRNPNIKEECGCGESFMV